jgi:hypothetical protein
MAMLRILGFRSKTPQNRRFTAYYYFTMADDLKAGKAGEPLFADILRESCIEL